MTQIAILGAGSIGCYLGGRLAQGGLPVTFIGRDKYKAQIAEHGLTLTHFERAAFNLAPELIDFATSPQAMAGADIIALCTKSQDTADAAQQIVKYAQASATVISFQNGIRNAETLREILPDTMTIIPAIVPFNVTPTSPGAFHCGTAGDLVLDAAPASILDALKAAGEGAQVSDNILGDQWAKMIVNLNNGLNTLSGGTLVNGLIQRDYRHALAACVEEALEIAQAADVAVGTFNGRKPAALMKTLRLPNWAYRLVMQMIVKIDAQARSSMLDDLAAGRPPEIEYLQGEIVKQAAQHGRSAPKNGAILLAVEAAFKQGQSPQLSGTDILNLIQ